MVLQPPEWLIKNTQKQLIDFVWSGKHWLRPGASAFLVMRGARGLLTSPAGS